MNIILYDQPRVIGQLLPFTYTRPISEIRVGILKISEKWERYFDTKVGFNTQSHLRVKYTYQESSDQLIINSSICPTGELVAKLNDLKNGQVLFNKDQWVGLKTSNPNWKAIEDQNFNGLEMVKCDDDPIIIEQPWHIFRQNGRAIREDFALVTKGRTSAGITDPHTKVYGEKNIFIEAGVEIMAAVINASEGPVYLGKNSMIHEGALIKGPLALCEGSHINMGAKMRGDNTIGPYSKVGGEVSNSVIFGYSNKAHDGFLGNSVLGEWCNIGADTNTSNLKNNYTSIKLWNYARERFIDTGLQFCGLMMGDHSKAGINTMFNTGTVVGVGANIFGDGFPRTFIPSFAWGGASGFSTFKLSKDLEVAEAVMARRNMTLTDEDRQILTHVFETSASYRKWENS